MKLPRFLNICNHKYKIIYKKRIIKDNCECLGYCDSDKHLIYIQKGMVPTQKMEVIIHESLHAISHINNISLTEKSVNIMALGLLGFIRNNRLNFLKD
jgi:Zn-dependent peptidase ImmA (M78 family)